MKVNELIEVCGNIKSYTRVVIISKGLYWSGDFCGIPTCLEDREIVYFNIQDNGIVSIHIK